MSWELIMKTIEEISDLQQIFISKITSPVITKIVNRSNKYCTSNLELRKLNNAILENQIKNTPFQITLINKINQLKIPTTLQPIYNNMKEDLEECNQYIQEQKQIFEYANFLIDLLYKVEEISEIEITLERPFEETEYAKMVEFYNSLVLNLSIESIKESKSPSFDVVLEEKIISYWNSLNNNQKEEIIKEYTYLSYDRNAFDLLSKVKRLSEATKKYSQKSMLLLVELYDTIDQLIRRIFLDYITNNQSKEMYNDFKSIVEISNKKRKQV